jgi:hypothetical protein
MDDDTKAVRPDFFANFESLKRNKEAEKKGVSKEEQSYYAMSMSDGWKLFNNTAEQLIQEMESMNDVAIANGASMGEVGKNTIVISLAKGVIRRLINKVVDAKEICEKSGDK